MAPSRRPSPHRQSEIADAVLFLLGRDGYGGLGVVPVAKHLGVTAGALYRHFSSWEAILEAAVLRAADLLEETIPPAGAHASGLEWLLAFSAARTAALSPRRGVILLVFAGPVRSPTEAGPLHADAEARLFAASTASQEALLAAARRGIADQSLRRLPPPVVVRTVISHTLLNVLGGPPGLASADPEAAAAALRAVLSPTPESSLR